MSFSSLVFALVTTALAVAFIGLDHEIWALALAPAAAWFAFLTFAPDEAEDRKYVLTLGGVRWSEADFCRGWEIDGRTGSGKTASGVVPIIHALKLNRPEVGILALDTKGDLSEPLNAIASEIGREPDIRQLEVRPDEAPPGWEPRYTMNLLGDRSIEGQLAQIKSDNAAATAGFQATIAAQKSQIESLQQEVKDSNAALNTLQQQVSANQVQQANQRKDDLRQQSYGKAIEALKGIRSRIAVGMSKPDYLALIFPAQQYDDQHGYNTEPRNDHRSISEAFHLAF